MLLSCQPCTVVRRNKVSRDDKDPREMWEWLCVQGSPLWSLLTLHWSFTTVRILNPSHWLMLTNGRVAGREAASVSPAAGLLGWPATGERAAQSTLDSAPPSTARTHNNIAGNITTTNYWNCSHSQDQQSTLSAGPAGQCWWRHHLQSCCELSLLLTEAHCSLPSALPVRVCRAKKSVITCL